MHKSSTPVVIRFQICIFDILNTALDLAIIGAMWL